MITLPFTVLQFISGVYVPFNDVPGWMQGRGGVVPAEVDGRGHAFGVPAGAGGYARAGRHLGTRAHRAGARGLDSGRIGAVREDLPLAIPRLTAGGTRLTAGGTRLTAEGARPPGPVVEEPRYDVYYGVVFAASLAIVQAGPLNATGRIIASVALIAMVPWYVFLGRLR